MMQSNFFGWMAVKAHRFNGKNLHLFDIVLLNHFCIAWDDYLGDPIQVDRCFIENKSVFYFVIGG